MARATAIRGIQIRAFIACTAVRRKILAGLSIVMVLGQAIYPRPFGNRARSISQPCGLCAASCACLAQATLQRGCPCGAAYRSARLGIAKHSIRFHPYVGSRARSRRGAPSLFSALCEPEAKAVSRARTEQGPSLAQGRDQDHGYAMPRGYQENRLGSPPPSSPCGVGRAAWRGA